MRLFPQLAIDMNEPFSDDHEQCPDGSDCNTLQSACLNALVRFNDIEIILHRFTLFYLCDNRVCDDQELCQGCNELMIIDGRVAYVSEDVLQAMIAAVLSYNVDNVWALNDIIDLYALVNIEQQTC